MISVTDLSMIEQMPEEIIVKVFSYFDIMELDHLLSCVCLSWRRIAKHAALRKSMLLPNYNLKPSRSDCILSIKRSPFLTSFSFDDTNNSSKASVDIDALMQYLMEKQSNLKCLKVHSMNLNCRIIEKICVKFHSLLDLSISSNSEFVLPLAQMNHLHRLEIHSSHNFHLDLSDLGTNIANSDFHLKTLILCNLLSSYSRENNILKLIQVFSTNLQSLQLLDMDITSQILQKVSSCHHLKYLRVECMDGISVSNEALLSLSELPIEKLSFDGFCNLPHNCLLKFVSHSNFMSLHHISLSSIQNLNNSILEKLGSCCRQLRSLCIHHCKVTDSGIEEIIFYCKLLEYLWLTGLSKLKGRFLPTISFSLPKLKCLFIEDCLSFKADYLESVDTDLLHEPPNEMFE